MATWGYLLFAFAAGAMLPIQFGINAQLAHWIDSPLRATLVSFVVGTVALLVAALAFARGWPGSERIGPHHGGSGSADSSGRSTCSAAS
jgi:uncharacterized membrane protein YdcZ (DUF606 family)